MLHDSGNQTIATILRHDSKVTSYKIALLRAINDIVLAFPDVAIGEDELDSLSPDSSSPDYQAPDVAIPLHMLAERWIAYYWPFVDAENPIYQGPRAFRDGRVRNDMDFRPSLTQLRRLWEGSPDTKAQAGDGFLLLTELLTPRRRETYPLELKAAFDDCVRAITKTLQMPIRYAGPGNWTLFEKPSYWRELSLSRGPKITAVPGVQNSDLCLVITGRLWAAFRELSLWVEALSIHEWCLFTESVEQTPTMVHSPKSVDASFSLRGRIYSLLTARPDNRRPLKWERNEIDLLMMEGVRFVCPWTQKVLSRAEQYDLDHLLPLTVYPINELWNLLPVDERFNKHVKRHQIPSTQRLSEAEHFLAQGYSNYERSASLQAAVREDAQLRFSSLHTDGSFAEKLAQRTVNFIEQVARARSVTRF